MATGLLSKGIKLSYSTDKAAFIDLKDLQEIPELGNGAPEKVEVTTLEDAAKRYIAGLGDSGQDLAFKFLYEEAQFRTLAALEDTLNWKVTMPDGVTAVFEGTPSVKLDGAAPNNPITYTLTVIVESLISFE